MIASVKGTQDLVFPDIKVWQEIEQMAREVFSLYGYNEIRTPILEHTELFVRGIGDETDIVSKEMYTFADKKGRSLTLRPENTAPVMRAVIEHRLYESARHSKLYYIGPQFRYERPQKGRFRQFHQIGVESLGDSSPGSDFECIYIAKEFLNRLRIAPIEVRLNSVGCPGCRKAYSSRLQEALGKQKDSLCEDCRKRLETNPLRVLDCKVPGCRPIIASAPQLPDYLCGSCKSHFEELQGLLREFEAPFTIYPRLVRGLDYYVKTVFEIVSPNLGAQDSILGGGRYDGLLSQLGGPPLAAFGWALGFERLVLVAPSEKEKYSKEIYIAWMSKDFYKEALKAAMKLREENIPVIIEGEERSLKNSFKRADKMGIRYVLIVGEDEMRAGQFTVKNLESGEQFALAPDKIASFISNNGPV